MTHQNTVLLGGGIDVEGTGYIVLTKNVCLCVARKPAAVFSLALVLRCFAVSPMLRLLVEPVVAAATP